MTSIIQYPDTPCSYPTTVGANVTTGIGNTPKLLAVFRNQSTIENLRAVMQRLSFAPYAPSGDTIVTLQLIGGGTASGGSWVGVGGMSMLEINKTATNYANGTVAATIYSYATQGHGNNPATESIGVLPADELGLFLPIGQQFALIASTQASGVSVAAAWSVNWNERS